MERKFHFNDILIQPTSFSDIRSRSEINPFDENGYLPIFTAPMYDVVDNDNWHNFAENKIYSIIPRGKWNEGERTEFNKWAALSLEEFIDDFLDNDPILTSPAYILIDVANGHMKELLDCSREAKKKYGDKLVLMVGNIANPEAYRAYSKAGVDYVRIGIGNGSACLTTQNAAIGYPLASLILDCHNVREYGDLDTPAKIVADGGIREYADIIKALALGADYVMLGSVLNKALESAGKLRIILSNGDTFNDYEKFLLRAKETGSPYGKYSINELLTYGYLYKQYRGMSTKEIQREMGKDTIKTSEGVVRYNPVEYTLSGWTENFEHYLRSNMSYTGFRELDSFIGNPDFNLVTEQGYKGFTK